MKDTKSILAFDRHSFIIDETPIYLVGFEYRNIQMKGSFFATCYTALVGHEKEYFISFDYDDKNYFFYSCRQHAVNGKIFKSVDVYPDVYTYETLTILDTKKDKYIFDKNFHIYLRMDLFERRNYPFFDANVIEYKYYIKQYSYLKDNVING